MSSFVDFEVLLVKTTVDDVTEIKNDFTSVMNKDGYLLTIVDGKINWNNEHLQQLLVTLANIEVTEEMVKAKERKVIVLQLARGFSSDDLELIKQKMYDALLEYDIDVVLLDRTVKLETADTFFNRVAKHLKIYDQMKTKKKKKYAEDVSSGTDN